MMFFEMVGLEPTEGLSATRDDAPITHLQDDIAYRPTETALLGRHRQRMQQRVDHHPPEMPRDRFPNRSRRIDHDAVTGLTPPLRPTWSGERIVSGFRVQPEPGECVFEGALIDQDRHRSNRHTLCRCRSGCCVADRDEPVGATLSSRPCTHREPVVIEIALSDRFSSIGLVFRISEPADRFDRSGTIDRTQTSGDGDTMLGRADTHIATIMSSICGTLRTCRVCDVLHPMNRLREPVILRCTLRDHTRDLAFQHIMRRRSR